jgi:hypothetical protein
MRVNVQGRREEEASNASIPIRPPAVEQSFPEGRTLLNDSFQEGTRRTQSCQDGRGGGPRPLPARARPVARALHSSAGAWRRVASCGGALEGSIAGGRADAAHFFPSA